MARRDNRLAARALPTGYYVYALVDPTTNDVFYIGKGHGHRMYHHESRARAGREVGHPKAERIRRIHATGQAVHYRILHEGLTEDRAIELEREEINAHGPDNLTNVAPGHRSPRERAQARAAHHYKRLAQPTTFYRRVGGKTRDSHWIYWRLRMYQAETAKTGTHPMFDAAFHGTRWRGRGNATWPTNATTSTQRAPSSTPPSTATAKPQPTTT